MRHHHHGPLFDRSANKIARALFIKGNEGQATPELLDRAADFPNWISALLMRHEGICFSVYGENMIIPLLLQAYGLRGLRTLLEQGAISFWLERDMVMYLETPLKGVGPLASGKQSTGVHADAGESVAECFRRSTKIYESKGLRKLKDALVQSYVSVSHSFAPHAVAFGHQGYELGRFKFAGFDPNVPLAELDLAGRKTLARLAQEMHDLSLISHLKMDTIDEFAITTVCSESLDRLSRGGRLEGAFAKVFEIEQVPDLAQLFREGTLDHRALPALRVMPDAQRFRDWMRSTASTADALEVGTAYMSAISRDHSFWGRPTGRAVKTLTVSALSGAAGAALGGPVGGVTGAVAGPVVVDVGMDLIDEFVLSGIFSGWKPRNYFERIIFPKTRG